MFIPGNPYCVRISRLKLGFFYGTAQATGANVQGMKPNTTYTAQWFNPHTGEYSNYGSGTLTTDGSGARAIGNKPSVNADFWSWVLLLTQ